MLLILSFEMIYFICNSCARTFAVDGVAFEAISMHLKELSHEIEPNQEITKYLLN